ncbi:hypothetical protein [Egbenema bharatensis]|uniref:hypothetical protein n=1 Tax=Egbenema bharatensis TaxID=3463334 RepID=UPI003A869FCC
MRPVYPVRPNNGNGKNDRLETRWYSGNTTVKGRTSAPLRWVGAIGDNDIQ